jgi:hypothetical protein
MWGGGSCTRQAQTEQPTLQSSFPTLVLVMPGLSTGGWLAFSVGGDCKKICSDLHAQIWEDQSMIGYGQLELPFCF